MSSSPFNVTALDLTGATSKAKTLQSLSQISKETEFLQVKNNLSSLDFGKRNEFLEIAKLSHGLPRQCQPVNFY